MVGGVVGENQGNTISNCYNTGAVSGTTNVGGVTGINYGTNPTVTNCYYYGYNVGIGGNGASQTGTTPFVKIANNPLGTGKSTNITEQTSSAINAAWSNALGSGFAVAYSNTYSSSNTTFATISGKTITGVSIGNSTISGRTMTITQNGLTSTGFTGTTSPQTPVPISIPLSVTTDGGGAVPPPTYTITVGALTHESVTANPTTAESGDTVSLTVTPASGYRLKAGTLKYNGTAIPGTSFTMPASAVTITAEFELIPSAPSSPPSPPTSQSPSNSLSSSDSSSSSSSLSSSSSSDSKTITVIETPTGIENPQLIDVTASGNAFDDSVEVRLKDDAAAKKTIEQALAENFSDILKDAAIFPLDISLYIKGTDTKVQPNTDASVEIICPIPTELLANKDNIKIVCVINGKLQVLPTRVVKKNGVYCVVFTTSHFSPYAFVADTDGKLANLAAGAEITDNAVPIYSN